MTDSLTTGALSSSAQKIRRSVKSREYLKSGGVVKGKREAKDLFWNIYFMLGPILGTFPFIMSFNLHKTLVSRYFIPVLQVRSLSPASYPFCEWDHFSFA